MSIPADKTRTILKAALLCALAPIVIGSAAFAQTPHGGGGGHSFSGGHFSAPAGRASSGRPSGGAPHFAPQANFAPRAYAGNYGARVSLSPGISAGARAYAGAPPRFVGNPGVARGRFAPGPGYAYRHWGGGYWHGGFWPRAYWGPSFAWFLPVLPAYAATYWWNSTPYYYYDNVYYTYDPSASGYVATTPPPAQEASQEAGPADDGATSAPQPENAGAEDYSAPDPGSATPPGMGQLFAYPKNGQSDEQQATDRQECSRWASGQTAADGTGNASDYQRAMTACLQGRGYSVN
jgi:hypothetical protein